MQQGRIYRASEIFPKYGNAVETEKTIANRSRRATKRGKISRASWEFDVVLNSRQKEIPELKLWQMYDIASIFTQFPATLEQLKKFSVDTKFGNFIVHQSIAALKFFKENLSRNFG